jgi:hypothetical protein
MKSRSAAESEVLPLSACVVMHAATEQSPNFSAFTTRFPTS